MSGLQHEPAGRGFPFPATEYAFASHNDSCDDTPMVTEEKQSWSHEQQMSRHRKLFEKHTDQPQDGNDDQRQKQRSQSSNSHPFHRPSSSKSHIAKYLRGRITPDSDGPGRRSLDSFAERQRRKHSQHENKHKKRYSLKLPIMSNNAPVTRTEFDALPSTVQKKFFSPLERERIAQEDHHSSVDLNHADPLRSCPVELPPCQPTPQPRPRHARLVSDFVTNGIAPDAFTRPEAIPADFYVQLPEKIQRRHLTSEEQILIAKHRRRRFNTVDPTDEVALKRQCVRAELPDDIVHHSSRHLVTPPRPQTAGTMSTRTDSRILDGDRPSRNSIYDSFRWLEDDEELDLRLYLDDYHANLREELPLDPKGRRPSFRRHISVNKLPFGLSSVSLNSRPPTQDAAVPPPSTVMAFPASLPLAPPPAPTRRRSRTLSLITSSRHVSQEPLPMVDAPTTHYQDPDARLKLRAYLASPQKFDEAIEFGFPSTDGLSSRTDLQSFAGRSSRMSSRLGLHRRDDEDEGMQTFLADDKSSIYSDEDVSMTEPESPKTPQTEDGCKLPMMHPPRTMTDPVLSSRKPSGEYVHMPTSCREMTLRMTLTRPDLRADEDQMYGWQKNFQNRKSHTSPLRDGISPSPTLFEPVSKDTIQRQFDAFEQEGQPEDKGVIRRIWKKVRRS